MTYVVPLHVHREIEITDNIMWKASKYFTEPHKREIFLLNGMYKIHSDDVMSGHGHWKKIKFSFITKCKVQ